MFSSTFNASDGDGYELQMGRWSRRLAPLFIEFAGVHAGAKVLDVGSGTGVLSSALSSYPTIGAIQGVDLAPAYVAYATKNNLVDGEPDGPRSYPATAWVVKGTVPG